MTTLSHPYGSLCSIFYDATKKYAPEREASFYASHIEKKPGRVLEAMSGSGRLQIPLIERGFIVDGVDNSSIMLNRCRERLHERRLVAELYEQSLEELFLPHTYTTITIAVGSFQLITDQRQALIALKKMHQHMTPCGSLFIDTFTPEITNEPASVKTVRIDARTVITLTTRYIYDEQNKIADAFCHYERLINGTTVDRESELLQVTWYTDTQLKELLAQAGFVVEAIYDETLRASGPSRIFHAIAHNNDV